MKHYRRLLVMLQDGRNRNALQSVHSQNRYPSNRIKTTHTVSSFMETEDSIPDLGLKCGVLLFWCVWEVKLGSSGYSWPFSLLSLQRDCMPNPECVCVCVGGVG